MSLSIRQIRAARALLGWDQADMAQKVGISKNAASAIERETVAPRTQTLLRLRRLFEAYGVEFLEASGVRMRQDVFHVRTLEGKNSFSHYMQDLIEVMRAHGDGALHHSNDEVLAQNYPKEFFWYYQEMMRLKLREKLLMPDTVRKRYAPFSTTECRLCNSDLFGKVGYSVYGNKFALYMVDKLIIIENADVAEAYRQQFRHLWRLAHPMATKTSLFEQIIRKKEMQRG